VVPSEYDQAAAHTISGTIEVFAVVRQDFRGEFGARKPLRDSGLEWCRRRGSNPHGRKGRGILRPNERIYCSSCHQKRALLFAEHVDRDVLGDLPVRQYVVTIPKMLRLCFKYDRKLLGVFSQCFFASVKELFQDVAAE
jgi:hypothetical protein